jgi:hypothetical protein
MICITCSKQNRHHRHFCGACGRVLGAACPRCSFRNEADDGFCGGCGDALEPSVAPHALPRNEVPPKRRAVSASDVQVLLVPQGAKGDLPSRLGQDDLDRLFEKRQR